jgi:hypothetical protein
MGRLGGRLRVPANKHLRQTNKKKRNAKDNIFEKDEGLTSNNQLMKFLASRLRNTIKYDFPHQKGLSKKSLAYFIALKMANIK